MSEYIRNKVKWVNQNVGDYGGDGEYAGSFDNPNFVDIQRAKGHQCVVARQREAGHWFWFRDDDTLLPWNDLRNEGAVVVVNASENYRNLHGSVYEGPFATEAAAKRFGTNYVRQRIYDEERDKEAGERFQAANKALQDLLLGHRRR
jgi:hypothetical protein